MIALVTGPMLLCLGGAILCLLFWTRPHIQRYLALGVNALFLLLAWRLVEGVQEQGIVVAQLANWPAPFGISLVADPLSALMVLGTALIGFCAAIFALSGVSVDREKHGYHPLTLLLLFGVCGAFLTGDLFNLYVWFEVLLMASFALITLGGERAQLRGGYAYVLINIVSSLFFLAGLGLLYGTMGTLNIADLAAKVQMIDDSTKILPSIALFFAAFAIKAGVFPLFSWLPLSYHTPAPIVSAIFGGLLTKVGVYSLLRLFTTIYPISGTFFQPLLVVLSVLTMVIGVLCAAAQFDIRRILSVHIVSQVGYITLTIAYANEWGIAAAVFFIFHQMVVKTNLFFVGGAVEHAAGSGDLKKVGGFYIHYPLLAAMFFISAMALAGIPPLSGFLAKLMVIKSAFYMEAYISIGFAIAVSLLTLYSMVKIWAYVFWKPAPRGIAC